MSVSWSGKAMINLAKARQSRAQKDGNGKGDRDTSRGIGTAVPRRCEHARQTEPDEISSLGAARPTTPAGPASSLLQVHAFGVRPLRGQHEEVTAPPWASEKSEGGPSGREAADGFDSRARSGERSPRSRDLADRGIGIVTAAVARSTSPSPVRRRSHRKRGASEKSEGGPSGRDDTTAPAATAADGIDLRARAGEKSPRSCGQADHGIGIATAAAARIASPSPGRRRRKYRKRGRSRSLASLLLTSSDEDTRSPHPSAAQSSKLLEARSWHKTNATRGK